MTSMIIPRFEGDALARIAVAVTGLAACVGATACDIEDPQPADGIEHIEFAEERNGHTDAFLDAKRAIDESAFTIRQADEVEWPVLQDRLVDLASYIDPPAMTASERDLIDQYAADTGIELETELAQLAEHATFSSFGAAGGICYTQCMGLLELACETGQVIGFCGGLWGCNAQIGAHTCHDGSASEVGSCNGETCAPGWRCARWAFKADECVQECDTNSDCPGSQKCKKPFGTSFKRCK